jgi:hypothetical protein
MDGSGWGVAQAGRDRGGRFAPAETSPAPPVAPAPDQPGANLHFACNFTSSEPPGEPAVTVEATDAPPRPPSPGFASACIRPAIRRRASRSAAPIGTGPASMDCGGV